jgi:hypothetical protein
MTKSILTGIATSIVIALLTWVGYNTRDVGTVKQQNEELKTELKELRKDYADFKDQEWQRYVELNTKTYNLKH